MIIIAQEGLSQTMNGHDVIIVLQAKLTFPYAIAQSSVNQVNDCSSPSLSKSLRIWNGQHLQGWMEFSVFTKGSLEFKKQNFSLLCML